MAKDRREDAGQYYPGGSVIPRGPVTPGGGGGTPADYDAVREKAATGAAHAADPNPHVTQAEKQKWDAKQDALTPAQIANIDAVPDKRDKTDMMTEWMFENKSWYWLNSPTYRDGMWIGTITDGATFGEAVIASGSAEDVKLEFFGAESGKSYGFATRSRILTTGDVKYALVEVGADGALTDRAINVTSAAYVTVPDDFADLLIRASVTNALNVTMPDGVMVYGDAFPAETGEFLVTVTKVKTGEAFVKTLKLEVPNA